MCKTVRAAGAETPAPSQNLSQGDLHGDEMPLDIEHSERDQKYLKEHVSPNVQIVKVPDLFADTGP